MWCPHCGERLGTPDQVECPYCGCALYAAPARGRTDDGRTRRAWRAGPLLLGAAVSLALLVVASDLLALSAAAAVGIADALVEVGVPLLGVGLLLGIVVRVLRGRP